MKYLSFIFMFMITSVLTVAAGSVVNLPEPEKIVLDNGMTIFFLEDQELPIVNFNLMIKGAGTAYEPAEFEGISALTASLVLKGNVRLDAEALADELDFMGASLEERSSAEFSTFIGYCLSEHFEKLLGITADSIISPTFKTEEFSKELSRKIDSIASIKDSPSAAVQYYFRKSYFGAHPMGNLSIGTEESLKKTTLETVKSFYAKYYRPDLSALAIVGKVDKKRLKKVLNDTFGKWNKPSTPRPSLELSPLPSVQGKKVVLVDKPDATQSYFVLGAPGFPRGDPVFPAYYVVDTLFGGRFTSWLSTELRIKRGLTYGARSRYENWKNGGVISVYSFTQNKNIGLMLDIVMDLLKKAHTEGFAEPEIESARNYIMGQFPPMFENGSSKAKAYVELSFYNLGFDYYTRLLQNVTETDKANADRTAKKILPLDDYILVLVGKAEEIRPLINKFGPLTEKKISDQGF